MAISLLITLCVACAPCSAEQGSPQTHYWWQDEIRTCAFALHRAAEPNWVARRPREKVAAGQGTLPVPLVDAAPVVDGELSDPAWAESTVFPAGPLFGPWREGPLTLEVRVCRTAAQWFVALRSPHSLRGLGTVTDGRLFTIAGQSVRIEESGTASLGVAKDSDGEHSLEVAVPSPPTAQSVLTFPVELVRREGGKLPRGLATVGLANKRYGPLRRQQPLEFEWLDPIRVTLYPAANGVRVPTSAAKREGVTLFDWREGKYALSGFTYREPVAREVAVAQELLTRAPERAASRLRAEVRRLQEAPSPQTSLQRRQRYCEARALRARVHLALLDAPLLFVKRLPYFAGHIYDDYLTFRPGGGIYVLENPEASLDQHRIRPLIDPTTPATLGQGVYRDPELSWNADRMVFAFKGEAEGDTRLYEIELNGTGLRCLSDPTCATASPAGGAYLGAGNHDITPAYLPDGRIVYTSTRPAGRVPCFNSKVDVLHRMNADGTGVQTLSVNNVNEFDPAVLPDGRLLYGRWEYVDKTALYMQSLWTSLPDGTHEEALFGNNLAKPTALLDARPVPDSALVVATLTPHNGQAVGALAFIDPRLGKNNLAAVSNLTPEYPTEMDQGLQTGPCDPWPLSEEEVLFSNNAFGGHGIVELVDRDGRRELVFADPTLSCFAPMLVKPRVRPPTLSSGAQGGDHGRFLVTDVYRGLEGVARGTVKWLRVVEETSRVSGVPAGGRWWNQAFLVSWQGPYTVKNVLGVVPVEPDGSVLFEAPAGRALYFQALDAQGRSVRSMRTFVQAVPGGTRACAGCHESRFESPPTSTPAQAEQHPPVSLQPEPWGSGFVDYPTMVQPILDRHCVSCHGGAQDIAGGIDLSGGWTWAFNLSYETLLKNTLTGFLNNNNGAVRTADILPPWTHGSGAAPLTKLLLQGHEGRASDLTSAETRLLLAWMDTNCVYYGTWDFSDTATCDALPQVEKALVPLMRQAGCLKCHAPMVGNDWINLQTPEHSRLLRAPLAPTQGGLGLGWCRARKAAKPWPLVRSAQQPPDIFSPHREPAPPTEGEPVVSLKSATDPTYVALLAAIRSARRAALAHPRVDLPGAVVHAGQCRQLLPPPAPPVSPPLSVALEPDGAARLSWPRSAETIGLVFELHRGTPPGFALTPETRLSLTTRFEYLDLGAPAGKQEYALVAQAGDHRAPPARLIVDVPAPSRPAPPEALHAVAGPEEVLLSWTLPDETGLAVNLYRAQGDGPFEKLTEEPLRESSYRAVQLAAGEPLRYRLTCVNRRGVESPPTAVVTVTPLPERRTPVLKCLFTSQRLAQYMDGAPLESNLRGGATAANGLLDLRHSGYLEFASRPEFELTARLTMSCWVSLDQQTQMPVVVSSGRWRDRGWFLQALGGRWRWHVGGVDCDGGQVAWGSWQHLAGVFDGTRALLFLNGKQLAATPAEPNRTPWKGPLLLGQYSGGPSPSYQVLGRLADVRLYRCALSPEEIAALAAAPPPGDRP